MAKLLLGKEVTAAMNEKLQARVAALKEKGVSPKLAIVRCGENPSDLSYEKGATARAELIGVEVVKFVLPEDVTKEALIAQIEAINADDSIHGCLMFRPLPKHLKADQDEICNHLAACKDVDCMTDLSNAGVFTGKKLGESRMCKILRMSGSSSTTRMRTGVSRFSMVSHLGSILTYPGRPRTGALARFKKN